MKLFLKLSKILFSLFNPFNVIFLFFLWKFVTYDIFFYFATTKTTKNILEFTWTWVQLPRLTQHEWENFLTFSSIYNNFCLTHGKFSLIGKILNAGKFSLIFIPDEKSAVIFNSYPHTTEKSFWVFILF